MDWTSLLDKDPTGLLKQLTTKQKQPKDPITGYRSKLLRSLNKSEAAHKEGKARGPVHKQVGDYCRVELTAGRGKNKRPIPLNGNQFNMVPAEHFQAFAQGFGTHVESGGFDDELRAAHEGGITAPDRTAAPRKARGPLSPEKLAERNAKREATLAARRAQ